MRRAVPLQSTGILGLMVGKRVWQRLLTRCGRLLTYLAAVCEDTGDTFLRTHRLGQYVDHVGDDGDILKDKQTSNLMFMLALE